MHQQGHYAGCDSPSFSECWCEEKRYFRVLLVVLAIFVGEVLAGIALKSMALQADAAHVAFDGLAVGVAMITAFFARGSANAHNVRARGRVVSAVILGVMLMYLAYEALVRFGNEEPIHGFWVTVVALMGAGGNLLQHKIASGGAVNDTTRSLSLHAWSDFLMSGGVAVSGVLIMLTNEPRIDSVVSVAIIVWLAPQAYRLFRGNEHHGHAH